MKCRDAYVAVLERIPAEPVVNKAYTFRLEPMMLATLLGIAGAEVDASILDGGPENVWFFEIYVGPAYARGTAQTYANLAQQSPAYAGGSESLASIMRSEPYRRRIALVAAREYEEMKGLSGSIKADMARVLTDGIGRGMNPREIAGNLTRQAGIEAVRASKIARTEIPMALRRARWDEHDDAQERYGIKSKLMHYSALSPTTRITHAKRHANLYTSDEVRDWYAEGANAINCKCGQLEVLLDDKGEPLVPAIVEKAKKTEEIMRARGDGPWAKQTEQEPA